MAKKKPSGKKKGSGDLDKPDKKQKKNKKKK
jgi:hypothetical protein